jgi:hypothetical protein
MIAYLVDKQSQSKCHCSSETTIAEHKLVNQTQLVKSVTVCYCRLNQNSDCSKNQAENNGQSNVRPIKEMLQMKSNSYCLPGWSS